ncbi:MAG: glutamate 5-kinase [Candidatus Omnitrophica bacterium]|nr:glutamate 5-kinase [Candidatus Omnitrophota bacterium]
MKRNIIVVKVGTAVLGRQLLNRRARPGKLDSAFIRELARQTCVLKDMGFRVIIVSSGAIGAGMEALGLDKRPQDLNKLQACAAIGQGKLMKLYEENFRFHKKHAAQILLTREDFSSVKRISNAKKTIMSLLDDYNAVPVINENDTIAVEEIKFGDNDRLSAFVAKAISAYALIMLTNVDGLYESGSHKLIRIVKRIDKRIERMAQPSVSCLGRGGMASKIQAANIAVSSGITTVIANGRARDVLIGIANNRISGTVFVPLKT